MLRWIIGWMAGQEVSRCTSNDASACMLMPVSVPAQIEGGDVVGGEPMMTMLRFSEFAVILEIEVVFKIEVR